MLARMKPWLFVAALAALLAIGAACGSDNAEETDSTGAGQNVGADVGYIDVSPQDLNSMLESKDFLFVNVHIPYAGEIGNTDLFVPYDEIGDRFQELPSQQDTKLVVYCRSGGMSAIAASTLVSRGYTNVWNLDGGMIGWEEAGYALVDVRPSSVAPQGLRTQGPRT